MKCHLAIKALDFMHRGNRVRIQDRVYTMSGDGDIVIIGQSSKTGEVFLITNYLVRDWFQLIDQLDIVEKADLVFQIGLSTSKAE